MAALPAATLAALGQDVSLLVAAWVLGGMIGYQRELRGHAAGLRTHALVCLGSCLLSLVSFDSVMGKGDSGRVVAQVVTGIGFLGAGVILRRGVSVHGLTTAASIWLVAGIGIAVGVGPLFALLAAVATALALFTLTVAKRLESSLDRNSAGRHGNRRATVLVRLPGGGEDLPRALTALASQDARIESVETEPTADVDSASDSYTTARVTLRLRNGATAEDTAPLSAALARELPSATFEWQGVDAPSKA